MQNRKRMTNMLIAGTLTLFVLTVFLAFRGGAAVAAATTTNQATAVTLSDDVTTLQAQVESLQAQNDELRTAVQTMQEREAEYQRQIEIANQTITELSAQTGSLAMDNGESTLPGFGAGHNHSGHNH